MTNALSRVDDSAQINGTPWRTVWNKPFAPPGMSTGGRVEPCRSPASRSECAPTTRIEATIMRKPSKKLRDAGFILIAITLVLVLPNLPGLLS
jgi:hypothetical protein